MVSFRRLFLFMLLVCLSFAQPPSAVSTTKVQQMYYTGGGLLQYVCEAPANVAQTSVSRVLGTLTNIAVSTNVGTVTTSGAHNLWVGAAIAITAPATTALSALYYVKTVPSTTTYTITTSGVSDGTYGGLMNIVAATNSPLLGDPYWYVTVMHYNGSSVLDGVYPGGGPLSMNYKAKCSDKATY